MLKKLIFANLLIILLWIIVGTIGGKITNGTGIYTLYNLPFILFGFSFIFLFIGLPFKKSLRKFVLRYPLLMSIMAVVWWHACIIFLGFIGFLYYQFIPRWL